MPKAIRSVPKTKKNSKNTSNCLQNNQLVHKSAYVAHKWPRLLANQMQAKIILKKLIFLIVCLFWNHLTKNDSQQAKEISLTYDLPKFLYRKAMHYFQSHRTYSIRKQPTKTRKF